MFPQSHHRGRLGRLALAFGLGAVTLVAAAGAASAHVRVEGDNATAGGYGVLTFRVPTESATASTTKLVVAFPADKPIASASTQPVAGWTAKTVSKKLSTPITTDDGTVDTYVASITWTADSAKTAIHPGQFQQFLVSAGPLPKAGSLTLPAAQTYSDGTVVRWNETQQGTTEPEHPAPVLNIAPASDSASPAATSTSDKDMDAKMAKDAADDSTPSWPGITGLIVGVLALILAAIAVLRSGRTAAS